MHGCNIVNNGEYGLYFKTNDDDTTVIDATNNWWGSTDSARIEEMIYHHVDNPAYAIIDYVPFAECAFEFDDTGQVDVAETDPANLPQSFVLEQNYPNPFNPATTIAYELPRRAHVTLSVYNILGRKLRTLVNVDQTAGRHVAYWDGRDAYGRAAASGIYFYRLEAGYFVQTRKMVLLK